MKSIVEYQAESNGMTGDKNKSNNKSIEHNLIANNFGRITNIIINILSKHDLLSTENLKKFFPINLDSIQSKINTENKNILSQEIVSILKFAHFGEIARLSSIDGVKKQELTRGLNSRLNSLKEDVLYKFQLNSTLDQNAIQEQLDAIAKDTQKALSLEPLQKSLPKHITPGQISLAYALELTHKGGGNAPPIINTDIEPEVAVKAEEVEAKSIEDEEKDEEKKKDDPKQDVAIVVKTIKSPPETTFFSDEVSGSSSTINSSPCTLNSKNSNALYQPLNIDNSNNGTLNNKKTCWQQHQMKCLGITTAMAILAAGLAYYYLYIFKEPAKLGDIRWDIEDEHNSFLTFNKDNQFSPISNTSMLFTNGTFSVTYENTHHWKGKLSECYSYTDFNIRKTQDCLSFLQGLYLSIKNPSPGEYIQPIAGFKTSNEEINLFRQLTRFNNKANLILPEVPENNFNKNDLNIKLNSLGLEIDDPQDPDQIYKLALEFYAENGAPTHHHVVFDEITGTNFQIQEYLKQTSINLNAFKYLNSVNIRGKLEERFDLQKNNSQDKIRWVSPQTKVQTISLPYLPAPEFSVSKPISHTIKLTDPTPTQIITQDSQVLIASKSGLPISMEFVIIGLSKSQIDDIYISSGNKSININQAYTFDTSEQMKQWLKNSQINLNDNICKTDETLKLPLSIHFSQTKDAVTRTKIIECDIKAIGAIKKPLEFISSTPEPPRIIQIVTKKQDSLLQISGEAASHSGNKYDPYDIEIKHITNTSSLNDKINLELGTQSISGVTFNDSKLEISRDDLDKINIKYMPLQLLYPAFSEPLGSILSSQICFGIINKITNHRIQSCSDRYLIEVVAPDLKLSLCKTRAFGVTNKAYYLEHTLCPVITGAPVPINWTINYNPNEIGFNLLTDPNPYNVTIYHNNNSGEIITIGAKPYQLQKFVNNIKYDLALPKNEQIESEILMRVSNNLNDPSQINPPAQSVFYRIRPESGDHRALNNKI